MSSRKMPAKPAIAPASVQRAAPRPPVKSPKAGHDIALTDAEWRYAAGETKPLADWVRDNVQGGSFIAEVIEGTFKRTKADVFSPTEHKIMQRVLWLRAHLHNGSPAFADLRNVGHIRELVAAEFHRTPDAIRKIEERHAKATRKRAQGDK